MTRYTYDATGDKPREWMSDYWNEKKVMSEPAAVPVEMACFAPSPGFEPRPKLAWLLRRLGRIWG